MNRMECHDHEVGENNLADGYFAKSEYGKFHEARILAGLEVRQNYDLNSPVNENDLPRSIRQKLQKMAANSRQEFIETFLHREGNLFGLEYYKIRRILDCYPVPITNLSENNVLEFPGVEIGEQPIISNVERGDHVALLVSTPYDSAGLGIRYSAPPEMGLLAMRYIDLFNHLRRLFEAGFFPEATDEIINGDILKYGVYAPDLDGSWIEKLKSAILQLKGRGVEVSTLIVSMPSQSAAKNQAAFVKKIGQAFREILIIEGGNVGFNLGSFDKGRSGSGHGMFVGKGEEAIYRSFSEMNKLLRKSNGASRMELPYMAMAQLMTALERGEVAGVLAAKMRTSPNSDTEKFDPGKKAVRPLPDLTVPKPFVGPYAMRFDGSFDAVGNPKPTFFALQDEGCLFGCGFCSYPQEMTDNTELDKSLYYFDSFVKNVEKEKGGDCEFGHWCEVPTFTALPPKEFVLAAQGLFNGLTNRKLFDPDAVKTVLAFLKNKHGTNDEFQGNKEPMHEAYAAIRRESDNEVDTGNRVFQHVLKNEGIIRVYDRYLDFIKYLAYLKILNGKYGDRFRWQMMTRIDCIIANDNPYFEDGVGPEEINMGKELLLQLCSIGLDYVSVSPENMNERVLKMFNKRFKSAHYEKFAAMLVSAADEIIPGTEEKLKDRLRIGSSFIMSVPDFDEILRLKREGKPPKEARKIMREAWLEKRKGELLAEGINREELDEHLKGEGIGMVDSVADVEKLMQQLKKLIDAGYNVSFAANHLTPLAPRNAHELKRADQELDLVGTKWWGAYLWLAEKTQADIAEEPTPNYGAMDADAFESRFDPDFGRLFMSMDEAAAYWKKIVGVITKCFGHREAVARQGNTVYLRTGEKRSLEEKRTMAKHDSAGSQEEMAKNLLNDLRIAYGEDVKAIMERLNDIAVSNRDLRSVSDIVGLAIHRLRSESANPDFSNGVNTPAAGVPSYSGGSLAYGLESGETNDLEDA